MRRHGRTPRSLVRAYFTTSHLRESCYQVKPPRRSMIELIRQAVISLADITRAAVYAPVRRPTTSQRPLLCRSCHLDGMPLVTLHSRSSVGDLPGERRFDHLTTSRAVQVDLGDRGGRLRKPRHCADAVQPVGLHVRYDETERGGVVSKSSDFVSVQPVTALESRG
jgi:hypothetical protein